MWQQSHEKSYDFLRMYNLDYEDKAMNKLKAVETMSKLKMVEALTSKISYPVCLNSRFEINLSCEMPNTPL